MRASIAYAREHMLRYESICASRLALYLLFQSDTEISVFFRFILDSQPEHVTGPEGVEPKEESFLRRVAMMREFLREVGSVKVAMLM